jgi:hypothetical protein
MKNECKECGRRCRGVTCRNCAGLLVDGRHPRQTAAAVRSHELRGELPTDVSGLRGGMLGQAEQRQSKRFTVTPSVDRPACHVLDTVTGRETVVPMYAVGSALAALAELFPDENESTDPGRDTGRYCELCNRGLLTHERDRADRLCDHCHEAANAHYCIDCKKELTADERRTRGGLLCHVCRG